MEYIDLPKVTETLVQKVPESGGLHTSPYLRLLLYALAKEIDAENILETGYCAGYTTKVLALSGAKVIGVDNQSEYEDADNFAQPLLDNFPNLSLVKENAFVFLQNSENEYYDLIFIDDYHEEMHLVMEIHEIKRVLRPNGLVVFHDTFVALQSSVTIRQVIERELPDWNKLHIKSLSPHTNSNFGFCIAQKP